MAEYLTIKEAAEITGLSEGSLHERIYRGHLAAEKRGNRLYINAEDVYNLSADIETTKSCLTAAEYARKIGLSKQRVSVLIREGRIPAKKIDGKNYIDAEIATISPPLRGKKK